jgi:hypothetical protein
MFKKVLLTLIACFSWTNAFGWGAKGHQIIAYTGANLASDGQAFWQSNLQAFRTLSTVPDRVWKSNSTKSDEAPTHWFQADVYYTPVNYDQIISFPNSYSAAITQYTEAFVVENGTAPWRIRQFYQLALNAFKAGDLKSGLEYAGALTHYVGDLSQPLHISENYDGQLTGNKGIHSYFETTIIKDEFKVRDEVQKRAQNLLKDSQYLNQFNGNLMQNLLYEITRSVAYRDKILQNDTEYGRTAKGSAIQLELAKDRMADGAATLALILNQLWKESGLKIQSSPIAIHDPAWVRPNYNNLTPIRIGFHDDDDCSY